MILVFDGRSAHDWEHNIDWGLLDPNGEETGDDSDYRIVTEVSQSEHVVSVKDVITISPDPVLVWRRKQMTQEVALTLRWGKRQLPTVL